MKHVMRLLTITLVTTVLVAGGTAYAGDVIFSGSGTNSVDGAVLSASVEFSLSGNTLTVTITNTGSFVMGTKTISPTDVLTAVYFGLPSGATLSPASASIPAGSMVWYGSTNTVGEEWQYMTGAAPHGGGDAGIGSAGLGYFGPDGNFGCAPNCQKVDGFQWGLMPSSYAGQRIDGTNTPAVISNAAQFELGVSSGFNLNQINDVWFQYGTASTDANFGGTAPEPASIALLGMMLGAVALFRRRLAA